jgi:predicted house-cleaning noncanonical NTP pyrophosphatase (MazG superfamily)
MTGKSPKTHNKLVRDRIPEIIAAQGRQCKTEVLSDVEYHQALLAKLVEEVQEVANAESRDILKELADLYEVIDAVISALNLDKAMILSLQKERREERGGFERRLRLVWAEGD